MNVVACLGRNLDVRVSVLFGVLLQFLLRNFSLSDVRFIAHQKNESVLAPGLPHEVQPFINSFEGRPQGHVNDDEAGVGISDVGRDECSESFLSCGVPELQPEGFSFDLHGFGDEVDADGGLGIFAITLEVNSKESWMNLEMMEVLPTF